MSHYEPRRHKIGTYMISAKPASNVDHSDDYIVLWVSKNKVLYNVIQDLKVGHERQRVTYSQLAFGRIRQRSTSKVYRAVL